VNIPAPLGDMTNETTLTLGEFLRPFGENSLRISSDQNFAVRNIPRKALPRYMNFFANTFTHLKNRLSSAG
jgi:hypothetical protein